MAAPELMRTGHVVDRCKAHPLTESTQCIDRKSCSAHRMCATGQWMVEGAREGWCRAVLSESPTRLAKLVRSWQSARVTKITLCVFVCTHNATLHRPSNCFLKLLSSYTTHYFPTHGCSMSLRSLHDLRMHTRGLAHIAQRSKKLVRGVPTLDIVAKGQTTHA